MAQYILQIVVQGDDRASGPLRGAGSALGDIGKIAGGIIASRVFMEVTEGILNIGRAAIETTGYMQTMRIGLETLVTREYRQYNAAENLMELATERLGMTDAEASKLTYLRTRYDLLSEGIEQASGNYRDYLVGVQDKIIAQMDALMPRTGQMGDNWRAAAYGTLSAADAMAMAQVEVAGLQKELENIAILSPYRLQDVMTTFRQAMAFGFKADEAKMFSSALLDVAAGIGADNEMLGRMSYNLAQIRRQNRITAVDVRQLAMAGFDLVGAIQFIGKEQGLAIKTTEDFNRVIASNQLTWEEFTVGLKDYATENFGGAAERMSRTLMGLKSTFQDVFMLTLPRIFGPAAEVVTGFLSGLLDKFLALKDSGVLEEIGEKLRVFAVDIIGRLQGALEKLFTGDWQGALKALGIPPETVATIENVVGFIQNDLLPALRDFGEWVSTNGERIKTFFLGFGAVLGIASVIGTVVGLLSALTTPIGLIAAAVGVLAMAWTENWGGIRDTLTELWVNTLQPALSQLWQWLAVNIPPVIAALAAYWRDVLAPAIQTVWNWLAVNIPAAFLAVSTFWTTVLQPALSAIWTFITTYVTPAFSAIANLISAVVTVAVKILAGIWQNVLQPALQKVFGTVSRDLTPALTTISDIFQVVLAKAIEIIGPILDGLHQTFDRICQIVKTVIEWIEKLAEKIRSIKLPKWLTPGSPTPFELGLVGIAKALQEAESSMRRLTTASAGMMVQPAAATMPASEISRVSTVTHNYYLTAQYRYQSERALGDEIRMLQMMRG